jgi:exodeoxyribonuclease VIII
VLQLGSDRERIEAIAAAVRAHDFSALLLGDEGSNEQTIVWRHPETELLVRVRADRIQSTRPGTRTVFDLKTTTDPSPERFGKSIANFGYHRQGALYLDAAQALYPEDELHFVLCVVRTTAPYEVACYELDERDLALGRAQYLRAMHELIRRKQDNDWLADWQTSCHSINMPGWAHYEEN